tara:strand:- start:6368 stop:7555 length:1188 start_codon:yes stop_codon:yes gene_type:complete
MRILLTGTYNSCNKGDAAMEIATSSELRRRGHDVLISTPEPVVDREQYGKENIVHASRRQAARGLLNLARAFLFWLTKKESVLQNDSELIATLKADAVIDLSGDMMTEDYGTAVALSHYHPVLLAYFLGTPYILLAQSIGPFTKTKFLAKRIINKAALVTAREQLTNKNLNAIGIEPVPVTADTAFLLDREPFIDPFGTKNKLRFGLSLSSLAEQKHQEKGRNILNDISLAFLELDSIGDIEILGIPHVTGPKPDKDDRIVLHKLADSGLPIKVLEDLSPSSLKSAIASCDIHIGARMHSNIAALSSAVPTIALSYSHKSAGIMKEFSLEEYVLELGVFDSENFLSLLKKTISLRKSLSNQIENHFDSVYRKALKNFDCVDTVLDNIHLSREEKK